MGALALFPALSLPVSVDGQAPEVEPSVQLARASVVLTEEPADSIGGIRITAQIQDLITGEVLDMGEVSGQREEGYGLFVDLASQLMAALAREGAPEARTMYALGQTFEAQGYADLAADAYQVAMRSDPDFDEAAEAWQRLVGRWELNAFIGLMNDEPEFGVVEGADQFRRDAIFGLRGAYHFPSGFFVQAEVANSLVAYSVPGMRQNLNAFPALASVGYTFLTTHDFHMFGAVGGGAVFWRPDTTRGEVNLALNYGLGGRVFLTRNHVLRTDLRMHQIPNALRRANDDLALASGQTLWGMELSVGLSWFPSGG